MHDPAMLQALLDSGLHQCHATLEDHGSLLASLALAGLVGGASHCAGMCGPFVLSQVATRLETIPGSEMREWHRLTGAMVLPYHLGRATTYAALGALGAALAGSLIEQASLHWLSAALLLLAAFAMLCMAIPALKRLMAKMGGGGRWPMILDGLTRPLFRDPTGWRGYALGLLLGFIPCGLLYAALAAAAASGSAMTAILGMLAFTVGTLPSLFAVGLVGHLAGQRWRGLVLRGAPLLLTFNAGVLLWLAWRHVA